MLCQVDEGAEVADLISLTHLHEPSILFTMRERYAAGAIYTYTGPILLAVNPFYRIKVIQVSRLMDIHERGVWTRIHRFITPP